MTREEALHALELLAASPAASWIGNRIIDGAALQKCLRCGVEETLALSPNMRGPQDVPEGFDEKLFDWKWAFQVAHEDCAEAPAAIDPPDVTMKRILRCEKHGARTWRGHLMCDACGRTYQTTDTKQPGYAPEICRCGQRLLPPAAERVGDILGLRTGGVVIDAAGCGYQTPARGARMTEIKANVVIGGNGFDLEPESRDVRLDHTR